MSSADAGAGVEQSAAPSMRLYHVNLNCTDYDRSVAFYRKLGFEIVYEFPVGGDATNRPLMGIDVTRSSRSCLLSLEPSNPQAMLLDLVQWRDPASTGRVSPDVTQIGFGRLCIQVGDIQRKYAELREAGFEFITAPGRNSRGVWICCVLDPDGAVLQLMQLSSAEAA